MEPVLWGHGADADVAFTYITRGASQHRNISRTSGCLHPLETKPIPSQHNVEIDVGFGRIDSLPSAVIMSLTRTRLHACETWRADAL
jgi:hypothetical protein